MAPRQGYILVVDDADGLLADSPDDYPTFIEMVKDVAARMGHPAVRPLAAPRSSVPRRLAVTGVGRPRGRTGACLE